MKRRGFLFALALALVLSATACTSGSHDSSRPPPATTETTTTFVAMGDAATVGDGLRDALHEVWPRLVFVQAFPRATVFVNTAVRGASIGSSLLDQMPLVRQLRPNVVAVWLGATEVLAHEPIARFDDSVQALLGELRATGARVLVADVPDLPGVDPASYNVVIRRAAAAFGAAVVPLSSTRISGDTRAGPFLPDAAGQRAVAGAFEAVLRNTGS